MVQNLVSQWGETKKIFGTALGHLLKVMPKSLNLKKCYGLTFMGMLSFSLLFFFIVFYLFIYFFFFLHDAQFMD